MNNSSSSYFDRHKYKSIKENCIKYNKDKEHLKVYTQTISVIKLDILFKIKDP